MPQAASTAASTQDTRFFGHPRGLATLFLTELWERFSYYGMRALLILYMTAAATTGGLGFNVATAGAIYGLYTSMAYLLSLPGGWIADRFLGQRRAVLLGGVLIALGNFSLAAHGIVFFYLGLVLIAAGTGLLKPNVSVMVGQLYAAGDARRDAGFSIFYMGINLGAFVSPLVCGYVGQNIDWHLGFAMAAVGMTLGLIQYVLGGRHLGDVGLHPVRPQNAEQAVEQKRKLRLSLGSAAALLVMAALLQWSGLVTISVQALSNTMGLILLLAVVVFFLWALFLGRWTREERERLIVVGVLFVAASLFWCVYEQAGSTLNLFAERSTDNRVFGFSYPASWLQAVNALFVILLAPAFAWLWVRLGPREPSIPAKFVWGLVFVGLGFLVVAGGASIAATGVRVSPLWLVVVYLLHTVGELCLSPVGLSAMTKLAPASITSLLMGVWFLSISVGDYLGGRLASLYEALPLPRLFGVVAGLAIVAGLILAVLVKPTRKLMGEVK